MVFSIREKKESELCGNRIAESDFIPEPSYMYANIVFILAHYLLT